MTEIGLFPLELVLLPTERVPLHIFEPRYKELIGECLSEGRDFGLVLEDESGRRDVGTRARVIEVLQVFDDGRMNIVIEGQERFRLLELTSGRSFATAVVENIVDEDEPYDDADAERALELFGRLAESTDSEVDLPDCECHELLNSIRAISPSTQVLFISRKDQPRTLPDGIEDNLMRLPPEPQQLPRPPRRVLPQPWPRPL